MDRTRPENAMYVDSRRIHQNARRERAAYIGELLGRAIGAMAQFVSKAWRSSSARGTKSSALS
jgi:hypothetical protein